MLFTVSVLLKQVLPHDASDPLWEENIILCEVETEDEAIQKAEEIGKDEEVEYESATKERVRWEFAGILSVYKLENNTICELESDIIKKHGSVVFSRFLCNSEVVSLCTPFGDD
jgi:hypothetical protein